mgnify:CR=1 FL=1
MPSHYWMQQMRIPMRVEAATTPLDLAQTTPLTMLFPVGQMVTMNLQFKEMSIITKETIAAGY